MRTMLYWLGIIGVGGMGVGFTGLALLMRKQGKNWLVVFVAGINMIVLTLLSMVFGFSL